MTEIPVLHTERLILREHREDDLAGYLALWSDEDATRFITGRPLDRSECWTRILRFRGMWTVIGYGFWVIQEKLSGKLIGEAGVMDARRVIVPSLDGTIEAGWVLHPSAHGRGLAHEAMTAVLGWVDAHGPPIPQSCIISEGNAASIKLAGRLGFRESARGTPQGGSTMIHYRREPTHTAPKVAG